MPVPGYVQTKPENQKSAETSEKALPHGQLQGLVPAKSAPAKTAKSKALAKISRYYGPASEHLAMVRQALEESAEKTTLLILSAITKYGTPYVLGGRSRRGYDCSGLVESLVGETLTEGISIRGKKIIPGFTSTQLYERAKAYLEAGVKFLSKRGDSSELSELASGDVLSFEGSPGHAVMVLFNNGEKVLVAQAVGEGGTKLSVYSYTELANYMTRHADNTLGKCAVLPLDVAGKIYSDMVNEKLEKSGVARQARSELAEKPVYSKV